MSFIKAIKDLFVGVDPAQEHRKEVATMQRQNHGAYQQQVAKLSQDAQDLQNQLAVAEAQKEMMRAMLQNQQQMQRPQPQWGTQRAHNLTQMFDGGAAGAWEMEYEEENIEERKAEDMKTLEKLLEAKV